MLRKTKDDFLWIVSSTAIALYLVMALVLISFSSFFFTQHVITCISSGVPLHCTIFYKINELPEELRAIKGMQWISRKFKQKVADDLSVCVLNLEFVSEKIKITRKNLS